MFSFRFRFKTDYRIRIKLTEREMVLLDARPVLVKLTDFTSDKVVDGTAEFITSGSGYDTYSTASEECRRWYSAIRLGLARLHMGADFDVLNRTEADWKEIPPTIEATEWGTGQRIISDDDRQLVYLTGPSPRFDGALPVTAIKGPSEDQLFDTVTGAFIDEALLAPKVDVACDLYGRSFGIGMPEARLVMLVTAIEALIGKPQRRSDGVRAAVTQLLKRLQELDVTGDGRQRLGTELGRLKRESISEAGERLVDGHVATPHGGETTGQFFRVCYELRSRIVHGTPRPGDGHEAASRAPMLEVVVGRLISSLSTATST